MSGIEIAPMALASCELIANFINNCRGASLLIDYGEYKTQEDTLRAYKAHKQVNILSEPGNVDITADVDFFLCSQVLKLQNMKVLPLFTQNEFLYKMGIISRVEQLLENENTTETDAEELVKGLKKLMGQDEMGTRFKALVFMNKELIIDVLE